MLIKNSVFCLVITYTDFYDNIKLHIYIYMRKHLKQIRVLPAGGKIEKNEMGGACGAYGIGERCAQGFDWED